MKKYVSRATKWLGIIVTLMILMRLEMSNSERCVLRKSKWILVRI